MQPIQVQSLKAEHTALVGVPARKCGTGGMGVGESVLGQRYES